MSSKNGKSPSRRVRRILRFIGLDIGGTTLKYGWTNRRGKLIGRMRTKEFPENKTPQIILKFCHDAIAELIAEYEGPIAGIGISICGLVDPTGKLVFAPNLKDCVGTNFVRPFGKYCDGNVVVRNDADCGGLLVASNAKGAKKKIFGCLFPGSGLGGCIVEYLRIIAGCCGSAQELGHKLACTPLLRPRWTNGDAPKWGQRGEPTAKCGCGGDFCYESIIALRRGIPFLLEARRKAKGRDTPLMNAWEAVRHLPLKSKRQEAVVNSVRTLASKRRGYDEAAREIFELQADALGLLCVDIAAQSAPHEFHIGGGWADTPEHFRQLLMRRVVRVFQKHIRQTPLKADRSGDMPVEFFWAEAGEESQLCGAALFAALNLAA